MVAHLGAKIKTPWEDLANHHARPLSRPVAKALCGPWPRAPCEPVTSKLFTQDTDYKLPDERDFN
jgi:hypothetical protein